MKLRLETRQSRRTSNNGKDGIKFQYDLTATNLSNGESKDLSLTVDMSDSLLAGMKNPSTGKPLTQLEKEKHLFHRGLNRWLQKVKSGTAKPQEAFVIQTTTALPKDKKVGDLTKLPDPKTWSMDIETDPPRITGFDRN
jgi:hypothetical protein